MHLGRFATSLLRVFHCHFHPSTLFDQKTSTEIPQEILDIQDILRDYSLVGAIKKVQPLGTKHLVPWFIINKWEGEKLKKRLILDCREINAYFRTTPFKLDHIQSIMPYLQKGQWAVKIDLKDAYFHLPVHPLLRPYLRFQVEKDIWEFQASCFGLSVLPQLFMSIMKPLEKLWRTQGIRVFVYLDDILLIAQSKDTCQKHLNIVHHTLQQAGFCINLKKSILEPVQQLTHLGFLLNWTEGLIKVLPERNEKHKERIGQTFVQKDFEL